MEIRRANKSEFHKTVDFIDYVFSSNKGSCPHDFIKMYPNLYIESDESMNNLINMWDGDTIVGSVLSFPRILSVGGKELTVRGIGSVACHPRYRGQGIMSQILKYNNEQMNAEGVQLSNLGGRRSRYNHFGYEGGGNNYYLSASTVSIAATGYHKKGYSFEPFTIDDADIINEMHALYNTKPIHYVYTAEQFFLRLIIPIDPSALPYAVYKNSELCGYIAVSVGGNVEVREICLYDDTTIADVILDFALFKNKDIRVSFYEYQMDYFIPMSKHGSIIKISDSGMWKIMDYKSVVSALISFKASYAQLPSGTLTLKLDKENLRITVCDKAVTVEETDDEPDFSFDELDSVAALTSPVASVYFRNNNSDKLGLALRWFPLPLACLSGERV